MSVLNIILIGVIGGVTFFQLRQGFFSSLLMAVCTTFAAALTMTCYEPLAVVLKETPFFTSIADGLSISLTFCLILFLLRAASDKLIRSDIFFGLWVERIGGSICGIISGITMAGILAVVFQLMPFDRSVLGYEPYDKNLERSEHLFPFYPDDYITGMWSTLSSGSMSGSNAYTDSHEDLLLEAFCWRNRHVKGGSAQVLDLDVLQKINKVYSLKSTSLADDSLDEDTVEISVRVAVKGTVMDIPDSESGKNKSSMWRLPATHFRLQCRTGSGGFRSFYPVGYIFYKNNTPMLETGKDRLSLSVARDLMAAAYKIPEPKEKDPKKKKRRFVLSSDKAHLTIDWVYRIPADCEPYRMIFRRDAKTDISINYQESGNNEEEKKKEFKIIPVTNEEFVRYALKAKPAR